jgi:hypothetical protein
MAFLDWVKRRREASEMKAISEKYGHALGAPGAEVRHYRKLSELRNEPPKATDCRSPKKIGRPVPSWER